MLMARAAIEEEIEFRFKPSALNEIEVWVKGEAQSRFTYPMV